MKYSEFCRFQEGYVNPSQKVPEYFGGQVKWLRATDLNNGSVYNTTSTLSEKGFASAGKSALLFKPGSLAISKSGTIGRLGILKDYMCGNRAVINIEVDEKLMNNMYVFYSLLHKQEEIKELAVGSVQKNLYVSALQGMDIDYKPLNEQKSIAHILSTLDEKIEVNNQINKTLESMAQALFKQWFIDFEFPDENGEPYKSSGRKMVESELGLIPKGWEVGRFTDAVDVLSGGTPKTTISEYWNGEIPFFTPKDCRDIFCIVTEKYVTDEGVKNCNSQLYEEDTVFITARGTVGNIALAGRPMAMNQSCYALKGKHGLSQYMVFMQAKKIADDLKKNASGSVFDAITINTFKSQSIIIPKSEIESRFSSTIKGLFEKLKSNQLENLELQTIRDTLLPKLMSGEIRVPVDLMEA